MNWCKYAFFDCGVIRLDEFHSNIWIPSRQIRKKSAEKGGIIYSQLSEAFTKILGRIQAND